MSTISLTGLNVLSFYVSDLERAKKFYTEILGFEESGPMGPGFCMKGAGVTIYLEPGREECPRPPWKYADISPCFATDGVSDAFEKLADAGVKIISEYEEFSAEFGMFRIADQDGNIIEIAGKP
jgi:catechol 2,3-dioxygenase-like lactoylglutathione lyase family enzyme